jgi:hypothetical protein
MSKTGRTRVRLLFVDEGSYHHEDVEIPAEALDGYARLIDCLREDDAVQKRVYVDAGRLCSAWVMDE